MNPEMQDYFAALGEPLLLNGRTVMGTFDAQGEVVLDGVSSVATTAEVAATAGASVGNLLRRCGVTYKVRQLLPQPPDGAAHLLVLAKV